MLLSRMYECFKGYMPVVDGIALFQAKPERKRALYRRWGLKLVELWEHNLVSAVPQSISMPDKLISKKLMKLVLSV